MAKLRTGLLAEIVTMAVDTLRTNKLRSALTVLGIVIGIMSIVGMTALIRGFDESLRDSIRELGPKTIFVAKFSGLSFMGGREFLDLVRRPNLTLEDAHAIQRSAPTVRFVSVTYGGGIASRRERLSHRGDRTSAVAIIGTSSNFADANFIKLADGRFFTDAEVRGRRQVVVLGDSPAQALFHNVDPIGKKIRVGRDEYTVVGVLGKRPSPAGIGQGADEFVAIPHLTYQKKFGMEGFRIRGFLHRDVMLTVVPHDWASQADTIREVEQVMRARHGLRLDQENDFDLVTQDAALKVWEQFSQATLLALVAISSIALMVGGIGVMAIMMVSVTSRTREIGLRKALGATRRDILSQFLVEAATLTGIGGVIGIVLGLGTGWLLTTLLDVDTGVPFTLTAIAVAVSVAIGIVFGMVPARRASRMDPIEALRHE
jgi:putative ABC transport system permease protein